MELPLIGKVRRPLMPLLLTLVPLALAISISGVIWRSRARPYDLDSLTAPVEVQALTVRIPASGTIQPVQTVNLSPKTAGIVEVLNVEQGDSVRQGDIIARMSNEDIQAQLQQNQAAVAEAEAYLREVRRGGRPEEVAQARAILAGAEAEVDNAQSRLDLAQIQLQRNQDLYARGAIPQNDLDAAQREIRSAQSAYELAQSGVLEAQQQLQVRALPDPEAIDQAEARLLQARAQLQTSQVRLEDTIIRAPFDGVITQKFATVGAFVTPTTSASDASSATSTAIVALANDLEVLAEVPEADIALIREGQTVEIRADAFPDELFQGRVWLIAPEAIERQNVTLFQVRITLLSGQQQLRSNMNVTVNFIGDRLEEALVIPMVAVVTRGGDTGVLIPGDRDEIRFQEVTLGPQVGNQIPVIDGIEAGQRVFIDLPPGKSLDTLTLGQ